MAFNLIETVEVGAGGASSVVISNIPQDGQSIELWINSRKTTSNPYITVTPTGGNVVSNNGASYVDGSLVTTNITVFEMYSETADNGVNSTIFGTTRYKISEYAITSRKAWTSTGGVSNFGVSGSISGAYGGDTATTDAPAISEVTIGSSLAEGTVISLYKVTNS